MAMPRDQDYLVETLIQKVARPESLIFVNQSGSPVELPWIDSVSTFLQAWYGGQEAGNALADILLGQVNPTGRLPISWPRQYKDLPFAHKKEIWPGVDGKVNYEEGTHVGYRWYAHNTSVQPQWWFGYGLSYTSFSSTILDIADVGENLEVLISVENIGKCAGSEVTQVYMWRSEKRDDIRLVGFETTRKLSAKQTEKITLRIKKQDTACWEDDGWKVPSGEYTFGVGTGVGDCNMSAMTAYKQKM